MTERTIRARPGFDRVYPHPDHRRPAAWQAFRDRKEQARAIEFSKPPWRHSLFGLACWSAHLMLKTFGLYPLGGRNALNIRLKELEFLFPHLPASFDGYRLIHLSDMHFDTLPGIEDAIARALAGVSADLCLITGDFQGKDVFETAETLAAVDRLSPHLRAEDGILAILGNHDSRLIIEPLECRGMHFLVNETIRIDRGMEHIHVTGLDDVHSYYTTTASQTLADSPSGFKIALVHSPGIEDEASRAGYALYLCGHTHGGQIALPGGRPLVKRLRKSRHLAADVWQVGSMWGHTTRGAGVSILPVRFNAPPEVTVITLRRRD